MNYAQPRWELELTVAEEAGSACKIKLRANISDRGQLDEVVEALLASRPLLAAAEGERA